MSGLPRLVPATAEDVAWLRALALDATVAPFLAFGAADALPDQVGRGEFLIARRDAPVAAARMVVVNERSRIAEVRSLMVDTGARGHGHGVAALRALADRAFSEAGLHRLQAEVYAFNHAAIATFERAGFQREGVRRSAYDRRDAWQDAVCFGLLAEDPRPVPG